MAVIVPRPKLNWRERMYLPAIVAGLAITLKHFKNVLLGRTKVTMQYPEEKWDSSLPDHYRGAPALVRDGASQRQVAGNRRHDARRCFEMERKEMNRQIRNSKFEARNSIV